MFDLARFRRLLNAQWAEQWRLHAWFVGVAMMVHFVVTLMVLSDKRGHYTTDAQMNLFVGGLMVTAPLFAARYFHVLARPESALLFLMRPASAFEKWLLAFLMVLVVYPFVYALAFQVCHLPAWAFDAVRVQEMIAEKIAEGLPPPSAEDMRRFALWMPWEFPEWEALPALLLLLSNFLALAILGSLWFRRMPVVKTVLAAFGLLLASMVLGALYPQGAPWLTDVDATSPTWQQVHFGAFWLGIPLLLWLACYFAVRERELA